MEGILLLSGMAGLLTGLGLWESRRLRRDRNRVPIRIHVNGTRGKSSVTRLIAAGLRAGGYHTCAKTTGTLPRFICPDGSEEPIPRAGRANIREQVAALRLAAEYEAEAVVLECMAVNPLLQSVCELDIVRATHGVITNARPDHLDVMGPTAADVTRALAGSIPVRGTFFTAERALMPLLREAARDRRSALVAVEESDVARISARVMAGFAYVEHPENVALALAVCGCLGIDEGTALDGMWRATPDPGAMTRHEIVENGKRLTFINAFAANDPQSTDQNWRQMVAAAGQATRIAVVNCREDRPDRTQQMAELCQRWSDLHYVLLLGTGTDLFVRHAKSLGFPMSRVLRGEGQPAAVVEQLAAVTARAALVMGVGNIAGAGIDLVEYFRGRSLGIWSLSDALPRTEVA